MSGARTESGLRYMVSWGKDRRGDIGPLLRAKGSQLSPESPVHQAVLGEKQEYRFSHSGQFTSGASLSSAICQSLFLQAGREGRGTADKVGCQAALITDHAAEVLFSTTDSANLTEIEAPSPVQKLLPNSSVSCFVPQKRLLDQP